MRNRMIVAAIGLGLTAVSVGCNSSSSTAPSGPCAGDERTASVLYGPPLSVAMSGDTTTYMWAGTTGLFIAQGSTCVERFR